MGLDMYLKRYPRYRNMNVDDIEKIDSFFDYLNRPASYSQTSLEEWCGVKDSDLSTFDVIAHYAPYFTTKYYYWDDEHEYPHNHIAEQVGYWRKANAIHQWFVDNVQDGEDDCDYHREVTRGDLIELRDLCINVVNHSPMALGKIENGERWTPTTGWEKILEDGKYIIDASYAAEHLPTQHGFFFGSNNYDQWYISDLMETIKICNEVLDTTDFETQMIYYRSSW